MHQGWVWTLREGKNLLQVSDWNPMNQIVLQSTAWGLKMHWQCAYWRAGSFKYSTQDITYLNQCPGKIFTNSRLNIFWVSRARFLILSTYFCSNFAFLAARAALLVSAVSSVIIGRTSHSKGQFNSRKFPGADIWPVLRYSPLLFQIIFWEKDDQICIVLVPISAKQYKRISLIIFESILAEFPKFGHKVARVASSTSLERFPLGRSEYLLVFAQCPYLCFTFFYLLGFVSHHCFTFQLPGQRQGELVSSRKGGQNKWKIWELNRAVFPKLGHTWIATWCDWWVSCVMYMQ